MSNEVVNNPPAAAPAPTPAEPPSGNSFDNIVSDFLNPQEPSTGVPNGENTPEGLKLPPNPAQANSPAENPGQTPAAPTGQAPAEPENPAPVMPPNPTPEQIAEYQQQAAQAWDAALDRLYSLEPSELEVIPEPIALSMRNLLKRAHNTIRQQVAQDFFAAMPALFERLQQQKETVTQKSSKFFEEFPDLNDKKYHPVVARIAHAMNQMEWENDEQRLLAIGTAARAQLKLPIPTARGTSPNPAPNFSTNPVSSIRTNGGAVPSVPAGNAPPGNLFESILDDFQG